MADVRWIYDLAIFLYAASVLFYFNDFVQSNRKVNRLAFGLLAVVWALQTVFFVSQMSEKSYFPVLTLFETLFFYSWILVTLSLLVNYFFRIDLLIFFTNVIGFVVLTLSMFLPETPQQTIPQRLTSELLFIHIVLALFSYGALSLSMIFSAMYMLQHKMLKQKRWTPLLQRLPSLERLEVYAYRMNMIGVPVLLLAIILGTIWGQLVLPGKMWNDAKVWTSLLVLVAYSYLLYKRFRTGWLARKLAVGNLIAFAVLLFNFLLTDASRFHRWL
ncbi:cytochrome C assembly family protein [Brevibacillus fulvus]|uniref:HemX protein n=1 Tax=Brevibacillus fulvus TaxID=1125967 RepID=A0A938XYN3_9BACL|nr:cytochrome c biogenesis protein CcsA [Brevibacillus fulvus]MBM7590053.1 HemX protein [Brevibacillus fulvus]